MNAFRQTIPPDFCLHSKTDNSVLDIMRPKNSMGAGDSKDTPHSYNLRKRICQIQQKDTNKPARKVKKLKTPHPENSEQAGDTNKPARKIIKMDKPEPKNSEEAAESNTPARKLKEADKLDTKNSSQAEETNTAARKLKEMDKPDRKHNGPIIVDTETPANELNKPENYFELLPDEIVEKIFEYLQFTFVTTLPKVRMTCQRFNRICNSDRFWNFVAIGSYNPSKLDCYARMLQVHCDSITGISCYNIKTDLFDLICNLCRNLKVFRLCTDHTQKPDIGVSQPDICGIIQLKEIESLWFLGLFHFRYGWPKIFFYIPLFKELRVNVFHLQTKFHPECFRRRMNINRLMIDFTSPLSVSYIPSVLNWRIVVKDLVLFHEYTSHSKFVSFPIVYPESLTRLTISYTANVKPRFRYKPKTVTGTKVDTVVLKGFTFSDDLIKIFIDAFPDLKEVGLLQMEGVTKTSVADIFSQIKTVRNVTIYNDDMITSVVIKSHQLNEYLFENSESKLGYRLEGKYN